MKSDLENVLLKSDEEWSNSHKVKLGNKWLITFWCGALISERDITTAYASPERAENITTKWHAWRMALRSPLVFGIVMIAMDGVLPTRLQEFLLPNGNSIYLRKEMFNLLPDEEELAYFCIIAYDNVHAVLVENASGEVIAIFSEIVPRGPVKREEQIGQRLH